MSNTNYAQYLLSDTNSILVIHGIKDNVVPITSNPLFSNIVIVPGGDHDLEKPGIIDQWVSKVVDFIQ